MARGTVQAGNVQNVAREIQSTGMGIELEKQHD